MAGIRNLVLAGCGTSLHASLYGAKLMREYDAFDTAVAMDAAEVKGLLGIVVATRWTGDFF